MLHGKCHATKWLQSRMACLRGNLKVLRIQISAINNDYVFNSSGNKQFAVHQEAQVTRAEEWAFPSVCQMGRKSFCSFFRTVPITRCHTWSAYPDLTYLSIRTHQSALRVHDHNSMVRSSMAASYNRLGIILLRGCGNS